MAGRTVLGTRGDRKHSGLPIYFQLYCHFRPPLKGVSAEVLLLIYLVGGVYLAPPREALKIATGGRGYVGCEKAATEKAAASGEKKGKVKRRRSQRASSSRFIVIKRWVHTVSNAHRQLLLLLLLLLESVFNLAHTAKGDCRRAPHLND